MSFFRDFVSKDEREFSFKLGSRVASSLSGFVAGVVVTSILWLLAYYLRNISY